MSDLQMVQGHIADMALDVDAAALLVYRAAWLKDQGRRASAARRRWRSSMPLTTRKM
jgi:alkylation response protein AidB-like acyl-CoA dehydrogenase